MSAYLIEFITVGFGLLLLIYEAFCSGSKLRLGLVAAGGLSIILVLQCLAPLHGEVPEWLSDFYDYDKEARFYKIIALVSTVLVLLMAVDYRKVFAKFTHGDNTRDVAGEFFCLPIFACAGLMWLASATGLVSIFIALELVTICFYVMVAYMYRNVGSLEAGVKYLILGALSTGFLVYGIAWVYGAMGTMELRYFPELIARGTVYMPFLLLGLTLVLMAVGFKVGCAPMHFWIPDVYQGAPTPVTAYLSVASKALGFLILVTLLKPFQEATLTKEKFLCAMLVISGATIIYGSLSAISQENFKRLLAYSSIAHAGFLLLGVSVGDYQSVSFYLGTYLLMTFSAFFILSLVHTSEGDDRMKSFYGLAKRNPALAIALSITMAAMAGLPLTSGFWGKLMILKSVLYAGVSWWIIAISLICIATGFYYYFKVIKAMYWHAPRTEQVMEVPIISKLVIALLVFVILALGIYPQALLHLLS